MKKIIMASVMAFLISASAFAEGAKVSVNGMVCSFCAQGIKKKFTENPNVESCEVDLDKKVVEVKFKKGRSLSNEGIEKIVKDAGYAVQSVERIQ